MKIYIVAKRLIDWKALGFQGSENPDLVGFMPVYKTLQGLREDYPEAEFFEVTPQSKPTNERTNHDSKRRSSARSNRRAIQ
jgi:hypothetical protein